MQNTTKYSVKMPFTNENYLRPEFMNGFHARLLQRAYIAFIFNLFHCFMARCIKRTIFRIFYFDDASDFF